MRQGRSTKPRALLPLLCGVLLLWSTAAFLGAQEATEPVAVEPEASSPAEAPPATTEADAEPAPAAEPTANAAGDQPSAAQLRSSTSALIGVAAVVLVVWIGLFAWVWRIDRRLKELNEI
jgi:CcmD family protein